MRRPRDLWFRVRALFDQSAMQSELEEEFAFHLEKEAEKYEAQGLTPAEARRKARLKFGGEDRFKEKARESWGVDPLTDLGGRLFESGVHAPHGSRLLPRAGYRRGRRPVRGPADRPDEPLCCWGSVAHRRRVGGTRSGDTREFDRSGRSTQSGVAVASGPAGG